GVDVAADAAFEIEERALEGAVDAHHHVGAATAHTLRSVRDQRPGVRLLSRGHAVLEVELDAIGAARMRFLDVLFDVDRHVEERAPYRQGHHSSSPGFASPSATTPAHASSA